MPMEYPPKCDADVSSQNSVYILGIRGVPANHGGFETFAENLSLYLVERGWQVFVYCQKDNASSGSEIYEEKWRGVNCRIVPVSRSGSVGSMEFDWKCIKDIRSRDGIVLILGYNTGIFSPLLRLTHNHVLINMDGIEWKRRKWSRPIRFWFWVNEWIAALAGTILIADHPEIAAHLRTRAQKKKIQVIPYGAPEVMESSPDLIREYGVEKDKYFISVCRIEPENSILTIVQAFSAHRRNMKLLVLGRIDPSLAYHRDVLTAASDEVHFVGAVYDKEKLSSLRFHARAYVHGHTVGGTNPSLVEALGAGNAVLAHNNKFNRWTAGEGQFYFEDQLSCEKQLARVIDDDDCVWRARNAAKIRFREAFQLDAVHQAYECLFRNVEFRGGYCWK